MSLFCPLLSLLYISVNGDCLITSPHLPQYFVLRPASQEPASCTFQFVLITSRNLEDCLLSLLRLPLLRYFNMSTQTSTDPCNKQYFLDPWPTLDDGTEWDGTGLLDLQQADQSPFDKSLDVLALLQEIQSSINVEITNVSIVAYGANHFVRFRLLHRLLHLR